MNDHVGKPFKRLELIETVNRWVATSRSDRKAAEGCDHLNETRNKALNDLKELMGSEWVESGLRKLMKLIEEIFRDDAVAKADLLALARRAHQLVAHAALLGFMDLSDLCSRIDEACTSGSKFSTTYTKAGAEARKVHQSACGMLERASLSNVSL